VLIIEKAERGGGNSFVSSANMTVPTDFDRKEKSDGAAFARYLQEVAQGTTPPAVIDAFVEGEYEMFDWIRSLGGEFEENKFERMWTYYIPPLTFPKLKTAQNLDLKIYLVKQTDRCPAPTAGRRVWELLDSHIAKHEKITIRTSTDVLSIDKDISNNKITGVALKTGEKITARAVVMACGGFEDNAEMKQDLLGPRRIGLLGSPNNVGDGVRLARKVGAELWHHTAEASVLGFVPPGETCGFALALRQPGFIFVNRDGKRFFNETKLESHRGHSDTAAIDPELGTYKNDPMWLVMDSANIESDKTPVLEIFSHKVVVEGYKWSKHSKDEIEKGWVRKAESVEELAKQLELDRDALARSLEDYNAQTEAEADLFGRTRDSMQPLKAPFYAMQMTPLLYNTQGGPQRNERAEIIDPDGRVIKGLYGAGECGSIWGHAYQSSTNFAETIVFGRIAGREAARYCGFQESDKDSPVTLRNKEVENA
jgi:succinate dehydrogenase/fumarate reductase flavoprotein subunit